MGDVSDIASSLPSDLAPVLAAVAAAAPIPPLVPVPTTTVPPTPSPSPVDDSFMSGTDSDRIACFVTALKDVVRGVGADGTPELAVMFAERVLYVLEIIRIQSDTASAWSCANMCWLAQMAVDTALTVQCICGWSTAGFRERLTVIIAASTRAGAAPIMHTVQWRDIQMRAQDRRYGDTYSHFNRYVVREHNVSHGFISGSENSSAYLARCSIVGCDDDAQVRSTRFLPLQDGIPAHANRLAIKVPAEPVGSSTWSLRDTRAHEEAICTGHTRCLMPFVCPAIATVRPERLHGGATPVSLVQREAGMSVRHLMTFLSVDLASPAFTSMARRSHLLLAIIYGAAAGLNMIHASGTAHGGILSENILIYDTGEVMLTSMCLEKREFGFRAVPDDDDVSVSVGERRPRPREGSRRIRIATPQRQDIIDLAGVILRLFTRTRPDDGDGSVSNDVIRRTALCDDDFPVPLRDAIFGDDEANVPGWKDAECTKTMSDVMSVLSSCVSSRFMCTTESARRQTVRDLVDVGIKVNRGLIIGQRLESGLRLARPRAIMLDHIRSPAPTPNVRAIISRALHKATVKEFCMEQIEEVLELSRAPSTPSARGPIRLPPMAFVPGTTIVQLRTALAISGPLLCSKLPYVQYNNVCRVYMEQGGTMREHWNSVRHIILAADQIAGVIFGNTASIPLGSSGPVPALDLYWSGLANALVQMHAVMRADSVATTVHSKYSVKVIRDKWFVQDIDVDHRYTTTQVGIGEVVCGQIVRSVRRALAAGHPMHGDMAHAALRAVWWRLIVLRRPLVGSVRAESLEIVRSFGNARGYDTPEYQKLLHDALVHFFPVLTLPGGDAPLESIAADLIGGSIE